MSEITNVSVALSVCNPQQREEFLKVWFRGMLAKSIAADPARRGIFARKSGMTADELGMWNLSLNQSRS